MNYLLDPEHRAFHRKFADFLDSIDCAEANREYEEDPFRIRSAGKAFLRLLARNGWLGIDWPVEYGGQGKSTIAQWLVLEELSYRRLPTGGLTVSSIGPTIATLGSPRQREAYLPRILTGELYIAVGYTEPEAGTDLAALRTRAVRDGDHYVINGAKMFTTAADSSTHLWLAARTGPAESRHKGISIFLLRLDQPGITISPIYTQGDERTNFVYLDEIRVHSRHRIGPENGGWQAVVRQLNLERLFAHGDLRRELDDIIDWAREVNRLISDQTLRMTLARLAGEIEVARLFAYRAAVMLNEGRIPESEASMGKVWHSELKQRMALQCLDLVGPEGQFRGPRAPVGGRLERLYRGSTVLKFAGGNNELQRDLIAYRGLGIPK